MHFGTSYSPQDLDIASQKLSSSSSPHSEEWWGSVSLSDLHLQPPVTLWGIQKHFGWAGLLSSAFLLSLL